MYSENEDVSGGALDIARYIGAVKQYIFRVLVASVLVSCLVYLVVSTFPPVYRATSTLLIEESNLVSNIADQLYYQSGFRSDDMLVRLEILQSEGFAKLVVNKLDLTKYPELNPYLKQDNGSLSLSSLFGKKESGNAVDEVSEEQQVTATARSLIGSLSLSLVSRTSMVRVSFESSNAELAAKIVNAIADSYVERELEANLESARQASAGLSERMLSLKQKVQRSEEDLQSFMEQNDLVERDLSDNTVASRELEMLSAKLIDARSDRIDRSSSYNLLNRLGSRTLESLSTIPAISGHESVIALRKVLVAAELKVNALSLRYGDMHPKLIEAKEELSSVREAMLKQMNVVADLVLVEYKDTVSKERRLEVEFLEKRKQVKLQNKIQFDLNEKKRNLESDQELYSVFFDRVRETTEFGDLLASKAKIISPAPIPSRPIKPKVLIITSAAFFVAIFSGIALIVLVELLDATIKGPGDVENKLGFPLLSVIPRVDGEDKGVPQNTNMIRAFVDGENRQFSEAVRTLRTSLTLASLQDSAKVLLVTSTVASEGKTTMSANLAEAYGQMGRTILIDADMRKPSLAKSLGLPPNYKGLSNAVAYPDDLDDCIHEIKGLSIDVMPSGPMSPNPLELLSSKNFEAVLDELKRRYEKIIIDSAPARLVSDALYLSSIVDGVVYVIKCDSTNDRLIQSTMTKFKDSNARVFGVILNQYDAEKSERYGGGYYYGGYYEGYGVDEEATKS